MTLIAAFRAVGGFVVAADSEENYGPFRRCVQKIAPMRIGDLQVIIAGSGIGSLIESFVSRIERLSPERISDPASLRETIEGELVNFYARDVATYSASDGEDKEQKFVIAAQWPRVKNLDPQVTPWCGAWATNHCTLNPITAYALAGVEDALYNHVAESLYRSGMSIEQAILAATRVVVVGAQTSSYIREPISVVVITPSGTWMESPGYITQLKSALETYEERLNRILLECADTTISVAKLEKSLAEFSEIVLTLHREHIDKVAQGLNVLDFFDSFAVNPRGYSKIPTDATVTFLGDGHIEVQHDAEKIERKRAECRDLIKQAEEMKARLKQSTPQKSV